MLYTKTIKTIVFKNKLFIRDI